MPETKDIVCLANSRKHSGRCVAGKEVLADGYGKWIRPVSARPSAEISEEERRYENGVLARVLDIIRIPIIGATPQLYHRAITSTASTGFFTRTAPSRCASRLPASWPPREWPMVPTSTATW